MTATHPRPAAMVAEEVCVDPIVDANQPRQPEIIHSDFLLPPADGAGYFGLTRIGQELLVVVEDYSLSRPRLELIQTGGLIQFDFRISGDVSVTSPESPPVHMNGPGLFIAAHPTGSISKRLTAPFSREKGITLVVTPQFFTDVFLVPVDLMTMSLQRLSTIRFARAQLLRTPLNALMYGVVAHFLAARRYTRLSPKYIEGLALELLCAALAELTSRSEHFWANHSVQSEVPLDRGRRCAPLVPLPAGTTRH